MSESAAAQPGYSNRPPGRKAGEARPRPPIFQPLRGDDTLHGLPACGAGDWFLRSFAFTSQTQLPGAARCPMTLRSPDTSDSAGTIHSGAGDRVTSPGNAQASPDLNERIAMSMGELQRSGWYWGHMTVNEAKERLQDAPEGTFLVRDSSHTDYLLTISVKTSAGPTNLRIEYREGKFRLDSVVCVRSRLKQFDSVVHLIEYYVLLSKNKKIETETENVSNRTVHLWLVKPLYTSTPSLQHLCRMAVNKCTNKIHELPLPMRLKEYITEYRYHV
ncbi:suppressor of cytokine signaling 2 isoform X1 [Pseudophryne corroboree]|uniref:suppressor of cytokine signaling 2 isoform X1 n=1 Tax=Pseudophryne corroboree TaxID=495146 RepID=UPI0030818563